jgi:hypothetical protein
MVNVTHDLKLPAVRRVVQGLLLQTKALHDGSEESLLVVEYRKALHR